MPVIDPVRRRVLGAADLAALQARARAIEAWPAGSHVWGHYAEETPNGPAICRTENVSACEPGIAALVDGELAAVASAALGAPVVAFKDKLNYKQPGGAGFSPHQDRLAYPGVDRVMSILLAIDDCSLTAGCLWLATGVVLLVLSAWRGGLNTVAGWVGVTGYPPAVLFAVATLFILLVLLHYSTVLSKLTDENVELAQRIALLEQSVRAIASERSTPPG